VYLKRPKFFHAVAFVRRNAKPSSSWSKVERIRERQFNKFLCASRTVVTTVRQPVTVDRLGDKNSNLDDIWQPFGWATFWITGFHWAALKRKIRLLFAKNLATLVIVSCSTSCSFTDHHRFSFNTVVLIFKFAIYTETRPPSGVAGPLAAQGGGQIRRPFVLGFWNKVEVRTGRSQGPNVIADDRYTLAVTLCFSCTQTHMKLTIW